jgi:hypothetical protein
VIPLAVRLTPVCRQRRMPRTQPQPARLMKSKFAAIFSVLTACTLNTHAANSDMPPPREDPSEKIWIETEAPPAPAYDLDRLIPLHISVNSSLQYGLDPQTLSISPTEGLVRYVLVARSSSGATNVVYEAIRCATREFKTYARASQDGVWRAQNSPQWRSVQDVRSASYTAVLIRSGLCDGATINGPLSTMIDDLKRGGLPKKQY